MMPATTRVVVDGDGVTGVCTGGFVASGFVGHGFGLATKQTG
jgi:hypothetical protein